MYIDIWVLTFIFGFLSGMLSVIAFGMWYERHQSSR